MEIATEAYKVQYDDITQVITCGGTLRLAGIEDYATIAALLNQSIEQRPARLTLDLRQLEYLNSSGISILLKFVLKVRDRETMQLVIKGSNAIAWQSKSLQNVQRLMPSLDLILE